MHTSNSNPSLTEDIKTRGCPTVCVGVMVKNEARIIVRALESARVIGSCWCVMDTGSSDDTVRVLEEYAHANRDTFPGRVCYGEFKDFGQARNLLLEQAKNDADWLLLMDADHLWVDPQGFLTEVLPLLDDIDGVMVPSAETPKYWNTRLIRTSKDWGYVGRTHEMLKPKGTGHRFYYAQSCISHPGDGGSKADKYERDLRLLGLDLADNPGDVYTLLRLGTTCQALEDYAQAITYFEQVKTTCPEDNELHYFALLCLGQCYKLLGQEDQAEQAWLKAACVRLHRREALFFLFDLLNSKQEYEKITIMGRELNKHPDITQIQQANPSQPPIDHYMITETSWLAARLEWARAEAILGNITQCREIYASLQTETIPAEYQTKYEQLAGFIQATQHL